jgi:hypothetical protein
VRCGKSKRAWNYKIQERGKNKYICRDWQLRKLAFLRRLLSKEIIWGYINKIRL